MSNKLIKKLKSLPDKPGVYLFKDKRGGIIYIGKAGSLKRRTQSYFQKSHDYKTEALVMEIADLEIRETPSALEALILEAELIKKYKPKYNIKDKDDKSFIYVGFTREDFSKPILIRGHELKIKRPTIKFVFGPYTSSNSLREALKILRGIFPWSECRPNQDRPCFYYPIKKCPGVCMGKVTKKEYNKNIRNLVLFFQGKRKEALNNMEREMKKASKEENFELAAKVRNRIYALNHIRDIALIKKDDYSQNTKNYRYNIMGRIEGYDISNISGQIAVGSMVVFERGEPNKKEYKKFKIKDKKLGDVPMLCEILERRFKNDWPKPEIILIDGGKAQVNAVETVLRKFKLKIPVVGLAKGLNRKNDHFVFDYNDLELKRITKSFENIFKQIRDEAHRFAVLYHRYLRNRGLTNRR